MTCYLTGLFPDCCVDNGQQDKPTLQAESDDLVSQNQTGHVGVVGAVGTNEVAADSLQAGADWRT